MNRSNTFGLAAALTMIALAVIGCGGGQHSSGEAKPEWKASKKIAGKDKGLSHVSGLAVADGVIFATIGGTVADKNEGTSGLRKVVIASGAVENLDNGDKFPQAELGGIAADEKFVYWNAGGSIMRMPLSGGKAEAVVSEKVGIGIDLAVDKDTVYWSNHGYYSPGEPAKPSPVYFAPKNGGPAGIFADGQNVPGNVISDGAYVYWTTPTSIIKKAKTGGDTQVVLQATDKEGIDKLEQYGDALYFGFRGAGESRWSLRKIAKNGGTPLMIAKTFSLKQFSVDERFVYFFDEADMSNDSLCKVPNAGGEVVRLDTGYAAGAITQDKTHIFFASLDDIYSFAK